MITYLFLTKNSRILSIYELVENPCLAFSQFSAFLTNCLALSVHNFKIVFLIDRMTLYQEFMIYNAIAIEENLHF